MASMISKEPYKSNDIIRTISKINKYYRPTEAQVQVPIQYF